MFTIDALLNRINQYILNPLIILLFVIALLMFFLGLVGFISKAGSEDGRETGKRHMIWGIVGIFIMVGVYGIIRIILNTFGIPDETVRYLGI